MTLARPIRLLAFTILGICIYCLYTLFGANIPASRAPVHLPDGIGKAGEPVADGPGDKVKKGTFQDPLLERKSSVSSLQRIPPLPLYLPAYHRVP